MEIEIEKATDERLRELDVKNWSPWSCGVSRFDWEYDCDERCYIMEGEIEVETEKEKTKIEKGDIVLFPKGLKCTWNVISSVRKVYRFE